MADSSSSSSFFSDFGLLLYLEELNKNELSKFKSFLKSETTGPGNCLMPWTEVKKANREDLANLMHKHYPGEQAWDVALKIFSKMELKDLCERAIAEKSCKQVQSGALLALVFLNLDGHRIGLLRKILAITKALTVFGNLVILSEPVVGTSQARDPEDTTAGEAQGDQEAVLGDGTKYRIQIQEKFSLALDEKCWLGEPKDLHHDIAEAGRELLEHLFDVDVNTGEPPQTVVLQGAAGVGKTTLVRKAMLDWAQGTLYQEQFTYIFYLNAREINQWKERSFVEMISTDWPSTEGPIENVMSQPSSLLFIVDSFDELNFAFEEPEFVLCEDWTQVHPVSFLMSSLLRKVMLPESFLLVTTRLATCEKLKLLLRNQRLVELLGMSKDAREEYIYGFFEDKKWALLALNLLKNNEMLFSMCNVPLVCWVICNSLEQQIEKGSDIALTCKSSTALFTCYICSLFTQVNGRSPSFPRQAQLRNLCHLAASGIWTMTHVFYRANFRKHKLTKTDVSTFLDMNILQKDTDYENCYEFTHLHIQEFFAAMFYVLADSSELEDHSSQSFADLTLLLESTDCERPHLTRMKYFLFGLLNEDRVKQLEDTLNCNMSLEIKGKILQGMEILGNSDSFIQLGCLELFHCLYETQDEAFITQAMRYFQKVVINICQKFHLLVSSFCLKHCQCLRTIKLSVTVVFEKMLKRSFPFETWDTYYCWQDLCSVLHTNEHLRELELYHCDLNELAKKMFYKELSHPKCKLQKLLLRFFSFADGCQNFASCLTRNQNLLHLDLKGSDIGDSGMKSLCEALRHPDCKLQNLSLESCNLTTLCCLNISKILIKSHSLIFLNLSTNNILDDGVELLCEALRHPNCHLKRLSLESCGLTVAGCEDLSLALISNKGLTHLCLADNILGDGGVKLISDVLKHPQCNLQSLVLRHCHFTSGSSEHLSSSLRSNKSLTHLDLASNQLQDDGVKLLCDVFRHPSCNIQDLELMCCVLTSACCLDLASAVLNNPNLRSLDLGNNDLQDDGVKILCEALRHPNCNIQRLGLEYCGLTSVCCQDLSSALISNQRLIKMSLVQNTLGYEGIQKLCEVLKSPECKLQVLGLCTEAFDEEAQKLLEAVRVSNPHLVIKQECGDLNGEDGSWWKCF